MYKNDPEARETLAIALTGLAASVVFILVIAAIAFAMAGGFSGGGAH